MKPNRSARTGWRARWIDPDSGKVKWKTLPADLTKRDQREDWCVRKSEQIARRRRELDDGAVRKSGVTIRDAEKRFYGSLKRRPRTVETYRSGTDKFLAWTESMPKRGRVETCDDLRRSHLIEFRTALLDQTNTPATFNKWLRPCKQMWRHWIDSEFCPRLTHDDLRRVRLEPYSAERRDFMKPAELRKLLEAATRHDGEAFTMTREEKNGSRARGTTPKYPAISGFVLFTALTGMRRGEVLSLTWDQVDFSAVDEKGREIGEIHIPGSKSKTRKPRDVKLNVSPSLRTLLMAQRLRTGGRGSVWQLSVDEAVDAMDRLKSDYGAPPRSGYQVLRRTCSTYLANAYGVPSGGPYGAKQQLGHGLDVMEKHYAGRVSVSPDVHELEMAMGIAKIARQIAGASDETFLRFGQN